jgi:hypothetical protein
MCIKTFFFFSFLLGGGTGFELRALSLLVWGSTQTFYVLKYKCIPLIYILVSCWDFDYYFVESINEVGIRLIYI